MADSTQRILIEILKILNESDSPLGARIIADKLDSRGYSIGERGVRYHLKMMDVSGLTKRIRVFRKGHNRKRE